MTPFEESTNRLVDVVIRRPVGHQPRAVAEIARPAPQQMVQPDTHLIPRRDVAGDKYLPHSRLETLHALVGRTRPQIPMAVLAVVVRPEAVAQEVEVFLPCIAHGGLRGVPRGCAVRQPRPLRPASRTVTSGARAPNPPGHDNPQRLPDMV